MYLLLKPIGAKWWRFDYAIGGKRKTFSLSTYPATTLADVRRKFAEARNIVANGIDPCDTRKETKGEQKQNIESEKRLDAGLPTIEERGTIEAAHRTLQICGQVFRYAVATGQ